LHRIVCDAWSAYALAKDITELYSSALRNEVPPATNSQYSDFVAWQAGYLRSESSQIDLSYWKERLKGSPGGTELPADRARPAVQSLRGAERSVSIDGEEFANLELASGDGRTRFVTLLAGLFCLLARYTGAEDIVIGTEAPGRTDAQAANAVGAFSNFLALRADCSGNPTFREMVQRVAELWEDAQQHAALPFPSLLDALRLPRDRSRNPLFQTLFTEHASLPPLELPDVDCEFVHLASGTQTHDLTVDVTESERGIQLKFSFATDLFDAATIERMMGHYRTLLQAAAANPAQRLSELPIMTPAERQQLERWNDTRTSYPTDVPLNRFIEIQAEHQPDATALVFEDQRLTYRQFNESANQLAHYLRKQGVGRDVLVGVCAERSIDMVLALVGIVKAGGAYVPLDPDYPAERLDGMLEDADPLLVLTQERLLDRVSSRAKPVFCLDRDRNLLAEEPTADLTPVVDPKSLAYAIYTSGSTGKPKGVPNVHEGIVNRILWMQETYKLTPADRVLQKTPYSFDVSVWEFFWPLMTGATLVVAEPGGHKDPAYLTRIIAEHKITTMHFVPSMLSIFLDAGDAEQCRSLRRVFVSGEALPYELQQRFFQKLPAELHNLYGPTEAAVDVTYWACRRDDPRTVVPIGRPVANTQIHILDRNLQPTPIGIPGELLIGGIQLARGYLNRPELTAEKFIPDPFSSRPDARLYKTGDLARILPDGSIEYLGRIDHQVKLRGFRIELGEIEAVLDDAEGIRQSVVVLREDLPGNKRLVAYVVPSSGWNRDLAPVRTHLKKKLPEFMLPSQFVILESFPMTSSGKVDRRVLPAPAMEQTERTGLVAPTNETEALVVDLFRKLLGVSAVSVTDDFFDLGGQSLLAARLLAEIRQATGKQIPLSQLFLGASPQYLSHIVQEKVEDSAEKNATLIQSGSGGPSFFVVVPPGENGVGYMKLARSMGPEFRVYMLQEPGPALVDRPYTDAEMQALAEKSVAAMRSAQAHGPYYFGGMCDGAHIAIRAARTLEHQNEKVGMLAVFDTWVLENSQRPILWMVYYYSQRAQHFWKLGLTEQMRSAVRNIRHVVRKLLGRKPETEWGKSYWPDQAFQPATFHGRVTLFKRPKQPYYYVNDPQMGWGARALAGVDVRVMPIMHEEMLHEPHVQVLGRELADCLREYVSSQVAVVSSR
jgi:amino acid adenylation domain-containing protein